MIREECPETEAKDDGSEVFFNSSLRQGGILLDMLAEVASKTLLNNGSTTQLESHVIEVPSSPKKKCRGSNKRKASCSETPTTNQTDIRMLPPQRLLRQFSHLECNELRKTFTLNCTFQPNCKINFTSFGSEARASKLMIAHLQEHISMLATDDIPSTKIQEHQVIKGSNKEAQKINIASSIFFDHCYAHSFAPESVNLPSYAMIDNIFEQNGTCSNLLMYPTEVIVTNCYPHIVSEETLPPVGLEINIGEEPEENPSLRQMLIKLKSDSESNSRTVETSKETEVAVLPSAKRKPKGKAKFIGQSTAERTLALNMIEQIKSKQLSPLDSLECRICSPPRTFTAPTTLLSHYRSHAGIKPFECRICRAAFTRQHSLNYHLLIHTNETRFTCCECGRKFRHPSHFREHKRRHTGEAPYECQHCNIRFKTRNTYKRHIKTRHDQELLELNPLEASNSPSSPQDSYRNLAISPEVQSNENDIEEHNDTPESTDDTKIEEDIVEKAIRCSNLNLDCNPTTEEFNGIVNPITLSNFSEIAKHEHQNSVEYNNNMTQEELQMSSLVDTVFTLQYTPAVVSEMKQEELLNDTASNALVMMM